MKLLGIYKGTKENELKPETLIPEPFSVDRYEVYCVPSPLPLLPPLFFEELLHITIHSTTNRLSSLTRDKLQHPAPTAPNKLLCLVVEYNRFGEQSYYLLSTIYSYLLYNSLTHSPDPRIFDVCVVCVVPLFSLPLDYYDHHH